MTDSPRKIETNKTDKPASLADRVAAEPQAPSFRQSFPPATCLRILVLAGLFVAVNAWQFPGLVRAWIDDPNWSHGFLIPLFSVYLVYSRWSELAAAKRRVWPLGLPVVIIGVILVIAGFYPLTTPLVSRYSLIILLFGLVLYLAGTSVARLMWLPILFLAFAMPIPDIIYTRISGPLQELAAAGSALILRVAGVGISATRSHLTVTGLSGEVYGLTVAEACAGMRLLMAFMALGVAMAYLGDRPLWQRVVLVAAGVPIAILCNVIRVTITCSMYVWDRPELGQDFMHTFTGIIMLGPALLLLWLLGLLLRALFVEVEEDDDRGKAGRLAGEEAQA